MALISSLLFAISAAICFGVQYVPVKKHEIFDGTTFQWFMCNGILMMGVLISIFFGEFGSSFSGLVTFGGMLWALSNFLVLPLVKLLGLGVGFSLYHFVNLVVGYLIGRFGLFGISPLQGHHALCDLGCLLITISFVVMLYVEDSPPVGHNPPSATRIPTLLGGVDQEYRERYHQWRRGQCRGSQDPKISDSLLDKAEGLSASECGSTFRSVAGLSVHGVPHMPEVAASGRAKVEPLLNIATVTTAPGDKAELSSTEGRASVRLLGATLALFAGGLAGVQSVPAALYNAAHPEASATSAVFPQCLGIWIASSGIYLGYSSIAKLRGWPVQKSAIRPAYFSGAIWAMGFAFMIGAIRGLGYSVGYTFDAVGPIVVASMLSIFVFKEITGCRQLALYWCAFTCQLIGLVLIVAFGNQSS